MLLKQFELFFLVIFVSIFLSASKTLTSQNCTLLRPRLDVFKNEILTRRKRVVLFPKKAFVLITQAFTKAIIDGRPPGVSYSIEFDMYSQLPDTVEAWQPTILNNKVKAEKLAAEKAAAEAAAAAQPAPTAKPTMTPVAAAADQLHDVSHELDFDDWPHFDFDDDFHHAKHNEIDIDAPPMMSPRFWSPFYNQTRNRFEAKHSDFHEMSNFYRKHLWSNNRRKFTKIKYNERPSYLKEDIQNWPPFEEEVYESEAHVPAWKYHQAYRERRDLFHQLETLGKIFNFDMKACIQRAMCELKSKLRPYGESLMEDIVRIILTIPKKLNFEDDYSFDFGQHDSEPNCVSIFRKKCPYRVLDFLTNTLTTIKLDDVKHNAM